LRVKRRFVEHIAFVFGVEESAKQVVSRVQKIALLITAAVGTSDPAYS
jgi:hypothetical protein